MFFMVDVGHYSWEANDVPQRKRFGPKEELRSKVFCGLKMLGRRRAFTVAGSLTET